MPPRIKSPGTPMTRSGFLLVAALTVLALCGCAAVGPDFVPPDPTLPAVSYFGKPEPAIAEAKLAPDDFSGTDSRWWAVFRDPILTSLAERVVAANLDVRTATLRLAESRFQRGVTASAEFPSVNGNASYQRELFSQNGVISLVKPLAPPTAPFVIPPISIWQTGFDASWEIDIWGRVRRQIEAADADVETSEFQRRDTLISALAELARDYIELRSIQAQIAITKANLSSSNEILQLTKIRAEKGTTSGLDVENAAAQAEAVSASLPALEDQETERINALSLLLDEPPGALRSELERAKPIPPAPPRVPLGIPSELARRRPDIRQAEARLHEATATIGVAVGDFYPKITFNGNVEYNALDLKNLFKGSSLQYVLGPSISLPIFAGGRLTSTLELREAQQQEAAISYHKTVLQAWHEVVNALVAWRTEEKRRAHLKKQTQHSREALALARVRYANGVADFLAVLDAERTLLQAELQYAQSTAAVSADLVQLYKALGGGWEGAFPDEGQAKVAALPVPP